MEETIEQQIEQRMAELPEVIREAILSNDIGGHIRAIGTTHKLHVDQLALLEDLTIMTMLGFVSSAEFQTQLKAQLSLDDDTAKKLAEDINTEIFMVVRESLKHSTPAPAAPAVTTPAVPPTAVTPVPAAVKITTPAVPPAPAAPKPAEIHPADFMLSQKTVTVAPPPALPMVTPAAPVAPATPPAAATPAAPAKPEPPAPKPYTADPYREPAE